MRIKTERGIHQTVVSISLNAQVYEIRANKRKISVTENLVNLFSINPTIHNNILQKDGDHYSFYLRIFSDLHDHELEYL